MQLLRIEEVQAHPDDKVYKHSRISGVIFLLIVMGGGAALMVNTYEKSASKVGYYVGAAIILFACLFINYAAAAFRGTNWLVRMSPTGLYVHLRSYLNYKLPPEDATVVFLSFPEIRSARLIKKTQTVPDPQGGGRTTTQFIRLVEMEIQGDISKLAQRLGDETGEQAPMEKKWWGGSSSTVYRDYPVTVVSSSESGGVIQIRWSATPHAGAFLEALRPYTTILETVKVSEDFGNVKRLPREEQEKKIRELDANGQTIEAIYLTRQAYGCSLAEAKEKVEGWRKSVETGS